MDSKYPKRYSRKKRKELRAMDNLKSYKGWYTDFEKLADIIAPTLTTKDIIRMFHQTGIKFVPSKS